MIAAWRKRFARLWIRWRYRQVRRLDVALLWPVCLRETHSVADAKDRFMAHVLNAPAWTHEFSRDDLFRIVDALLPPDDVKAFY